MMENPLFVMPTDPENVVIAVVLSANRPVLFSGSTVRPDGVGTTWVLSAVWPGLFNGNRAMLSNNKQALSLFIYSQLFNELIRHCKTTCCLKVRPYPFYGFTYHFYGCPSNARILWTALIQKKAMIIYDTIKKYSETFNNRTLHPLINLVDLNKSAPLQRVKFRLDFYAIIVKESDCGELRYGNQYYDYSEGTVVFIGPGQVMTSMPEGEVHQPTGKALIFHPDLLKGTNLGKQMHEYSFFSYQFNEALHLSDSERNTVEACFANIAAEIGQNIDRHSKKLLVANLELLLNYCTRFYDRQFITREHVNHGLLGQFEEKLRAYLQGEKLQTEGLPSVAHFAEELHLSPNYFGDLIKKETGKTALEHIQLYLLELAKERMFDPSKSVSEISYELGFKYPQHFTRFFKQKVGVSPNEYRGEHLKQLRVHRG